MVDIDYSHTQPPYQYNIISMIRVEELTRVEEQEDLTAMMAYSQNWKIGS